jgi:hypothetical protein
MPTQNGYSLIEISTGEEIMAWVWDTYGELPLIPNIIRLPNGDHVHCPNLEVSYTGYKLTAKFTDDEPPDPGTIMPTMIAAAYNIEVSGGDIQSIGGAGNLIGALYLDVGSYMLLFLSAEVDTNYVAQVLDGGLSIRVIEKGLDYMIVEAKDGGGNPADPGQFGIQVYRV